MALMKHLKSQHQIQQLDNVERSSPILTEIPALSCGKVREGKWNELCNDTNDNLSLLFY